LKTRLVREATTRGIPAEQGHRTAAAWLRSTLLMDPTPARDLAELAYALHKSPAVEQALVDGAVDAKQASVITTAVANLPEDLPDSEQVASKAEGALLDLARRFPAYQLRRLGERILTQVAPDVADEAEEKTLRRQEARAYASRGFTMSQPIDGIVRLSGALSVEDAATVSAALQPLCTPIAGDHRTARQRRSDALVEVCRLALRTEELPEHGGEPPQMTVTVPYEPVAAALVAGSLDNGTRVSAATVRQQACDARILPVVLGGAGQVIDVGRSRRLVSGPLRRALVVRDGGCAFPDCDRPPRWCDGHHIQPWMSGGGTDLENTVLLCRHHHRMLHDPEGGWQVRLGPQRVPEFVPPVWVDPLQAPRRNEYYQRR
jgi:hypothetical protein